jgi:hypothetical protein
MRRSCSLGVLCGKLCKDCLSEDVYDHRPHRCLRCYLKYDYSCKKANLNRAEVRSKYKKKLYSDNIKGLSCRANAAVAKAKRLGILVANPCEVCGSIETEAHHDSYLKRNWLRVRWLCFKDHRSWHKLNKPEYPKKKVAS